MGLYRFNQSATADMAFLFGLKMPTGETHEEGFRNEVFVRRVDTGVFPESDHDDEDHEEEASGHHHDGNRLETHQQPGSGSYDPIVGFAYSRVLGGINLDSSLLYTFAKDGSQDADLGDTFKYNVALAYELQADLDLVLELNGEWHDRELRGSEVIENSGGNILYLSPGIRYRFADSWSASISYGQALITDLHGFQSEPDNRWSGNFSFHF